MDATTPRGDDESTADAAATPPPLIEPVQPARAAGSTSVGVADAPVGGTPSALQTAADAGPEDPSAPDVPVEATLTREQAGSSPAEPIVPTAAPDDATVRSAPPAPAEPATAPTAPAHAGPAGTGAYPAAGAREVVYVAAPTPPKKKGNRGIGVLIAVLSAFIFVFCYALASLVIRAVVSGDTRIDFLADASFYIPVLLFTLGFVLLALVVNRAGWWSFVLGSILVGVFVYLGTIGVLLLNQAGSLTPSAASGQFRQYLINPLVIAAGLVAREVALWVGAGISARGRRVSARNAEAREHFDREQAERRAEIERNGAVLRGA